MAYNDDMTNIYQFKHRLFPAILPIAIPTVMVPLSLASAWTIHACQAARMNLHYYRQRGVTPTAPPDGAGGPSRTQDEAISKLKLASFKPLPLDGYTSTGLRGLTDIAPMYFDSGRILRGRLHRYPHHFHETLIPVTGGTPISGIMGLHHGKLPRPGLVIVHGLLNSKRQDLVRVVTMRAFYEWGFNVCAIDLRGFGRSAESVSVPSGAGGIEAQDVIDVVKYLKKFPHFTSVGLIGFSLGGGTVLHVGAHKEAPGLIDGGIMAVSPPINFEAAMKRLEAPPEDHEYLMVYHFFRYLLNRSLTHAEIMRWVRKRLEKEGGNPNIGGFHDYLRNLVAWGYLGHGRKKQRDPDVLLDILLRLTSPSRVLSRIQVPTFILHAKDDPMIRITDNELALLERVSQQSEFVRYHVTERGGHTAYVAVDPGWFYGVVRSYFTYWGQWTTVKRHPFHSGVNVSGLNEVSLNGNGVNAPLRNRRSGDRNGEKDTTIHGSGVPVNGTGLNGNGLNGTGVPVNGVTVNGVSVNGIGVAVNGLNGNGAAVNGNGLNGNGAAVNGNGLNGNGGLQLEGQDAHEEIPSIGSAAASGALQQAHR